MVSWIYQAGEKSFFILELTQLAFTCSKPAIETLEEGV